MKRLTDSEFGKDIRRHQFIRTHIRRDPPVADHDDPVYILSLIHI